MGMAMPPPLGRGHVYVSDKLTAFPRTRADDLPCSLWIPLRSEEEEADPEKVQKLAEMIAILRKVSIGHDASQMYTDFHFRPSSSTPRDACTPFSASSCFSSSSSPLPWCCQRCCKGSNKTFRDSSRAVLVGTRAIMGL